MTARAVAAPAVALAALLAGCNLGYYCHLAGGQARLLVHARPVSQVLAGADLDSTRHQRLEFTQQVRAYGIRHLGLRGGRAYTRFVDLGGRPVERLPLDERHFVARKLPVVRERAPRVLPRLRLGCADAR